MIYPMIAISLFVVLLLVCLLVVYHRKNKEKKGMGKGDIDYRAFYIMGISFLPLGIIFTAAISPAFVSFIALGIIYMAIGIQHKDEWKDHKKKKK